MNETPRRRSASRGKAKQRRKTLFSRLLVPTDLSACSRHALRHAAWLARDAGAELHLVHVVEEQHDEDTPGYSELDSAYDRLAEAVSTRLRDDATEARAGGAIALQSHVVRGPHVGPVLLKYVEEHDIDLIVMGTHGRRGAEPLLIGSTAEQIVRVAPCSVWTVGPAGSLVPGLVKRLLVTVDFSESSPGVVAVAKHLAARYQARLHLLHVVMPYLRPVFLADHPRAFEFSAARVERRAREEIDALYHQSPGPEVSAVQYHVVRGRPATTITAFAREQRVHLIVQGARGLSDAPAIPLGGVAGEVVRTAPSPVFTARPSHLWPGTSPATPDSPSS